MTIAAHPASSNRLTVSRLADIGDAPAMNGLSSGIPRYVVVQDIGFPFTLNGR
jgi:hypothetical protein